MDPARLIDLPKIERAGRRAVHPFQVQFVGGTRRFLTKQAAAAAIGAVVAAGDPRTVAARAEARRIAAEVAAEVEAAVLAESADV